MADIGLIGLGTMGAARWREHGRRRAADVGGSGNRSGEPHASVSMAEAGDLPPRPETAPEDLGGVWSKPSRTPRAIVIMVKAGAPVRSVIKPQPFTRRRRYQLIDAGTRISRTPATAKRALPKNGFNFMGNRRNRAEKRARATAPRSWQRIESGMGTASPILRAIAADYEGQPLCSPCRTGWRQAILLKNVP